eukprot:TRINITY_DN17171_c0_g1_i1.p1 TRINITY_DN17171_c0_g1~~TRINITY_DN17171_c0_g1_i1.p1  ORF type:complete len:815 (+),score=178.62 TRINITY_DN17171_c0_g1_i1:73-2445(+)
MAIDMSVLSSAAFTVHEQVKSPSQASPAVLAAYLQRGVSCSPPPEPRAVRRTPAPPVQGRDSGSSGTSSSVGYASGPRAPDPPPPPPRSRRALAAVPVWETAQPPVLRSNQADVVLYPAEVVRISRSRSSSAKRGPSPIASRGSTSPSAPRSEHRLRVFRRQLDSPAEPEDLARVTAGRRAGSPGLRRIQRQPSAAGALNPPPRLRHGTPRSRVGRTRSPSPGVRQRLARTATTSPPVTSPTRRVRTPTPPEQNAAGSRVSAEPAPEPFPEAPGTSDSAPSPMYVPPQPQERNVTESVAPSPLRTAPQPSRRVERPAATALKPADDEESWLVASGDIHREVPMPPLLSRTATPASGGLDREGGLDRDVSAVEVSESDATSIGEAARRRVANPSASSQALSVRFLAIESPLPDSPTSGSLAAPVPSLRARTRSTREAAAAQTLPDTVLSAAPVRATPRATPTQADSRPASTVGETLSTVPPPVRQGAALVSARVPEPVRCRGQDSAAADGAAPPVGSADSSPPLSPLSAVTSDSPPHQPLPADSRPSNGAVREWLASGREGWRRVLGEEPRVTAPLGPHTICFAAYDDSESEEAPPEAEGRAPAPAAAGGGSEPGDDGDDSSNGSLAQREMGWVPPKKLTASELTRRDEDGFRPPPRPARPPADLPARRQPPDAELFTRLSRPRARTPARATGKPPVLRRSRSAGSCGRAKTDAASEARSEVFDRLAQPASRRMPSDYKGWDRGTECTFQPALRPHYATSDARLGVGEVFQRLRDDGRRRQRAAVATTSAR